VLWSWNRYMDPKTDWRCLTRIRRPQRPEGESVTAPDAADRGDEAQQAQRLFLDTLARTDCGMAGVLHKDSVKADGSFDKPIGTGPFKLGEWKRGEYVTLTAFEGYTSSPDGKQRRLHRLQAPAGEGGEVPGRPRPATVKAGLKSGAVDMGEILDSDVAGAAKAPQPDGQDHHQRRQAT
jgi:peptide/nickel transport system substrate-binding protein